MQLVLATGSNVGDRAANLLAAKKLLGDHFGELVRESSVRETKAWGLEEQADFLNQVLVYHLGVPQYCGRAGVYPTRADLHTLLDAVQSVEQTLGRRRQTHWGPRTIDIDVIFLGDLRYEDERLSIPHPWWAEREFVGGIIREELPEVLIPVGFLHSAAASGPAARPWA